MSLCETDGMAKMVYPDVQGTAGLPVPVTRPLMLMVMLSRVRFLIIILLRPTLTTLIAALPIVDISLSSIPMLCVRKQDGVRPLLSVAASCGQCKGLAECIASLTQSRRWISQPQATLHPIASLTIKVEAIAVLIRCSLQGHIFV